MKFMIVFATVVDVPPAVSKAMVSSFRFVIGESTGTVTIEPLIWKATDFSSVPAEGFTENNSMVKGIRKQSVCLSCFFVKVASLPWPHVIVYAVV